jgi:hypothetical protein
MIRPALALALTCAASAADAQMSAPPITSALPNMSTISPGNAAGLLQYCISKNLVSSTSGALVLDDLTRKHGMTKTHEFTAGASGHILGDKRFSIGSAPGFLQSQACDLVLTQAKRSL